MGETSDSEASTVNTASSPLVAVYSDKDPEPSPTRPGPETIIPTAETTATQKEPVPSHPAKNPSDPPATRTADKTEEALINPERADGQKKSKEKEKAADGKKNKHRDQEREKKRGRSTEKSKKLSFYEKQSTQRQHRSRTPRRGEKDQTPVRKDKSTKPKKAGKVTKERAKSTKKVTTRNKKEHRNKKSRQGRQRQLSETSVSQISVSISEPSSNGSTLRAKKSILRRELRKTTEGRERFGDFGRDDFARATTIFFDAGYHRLGNIRRVQGDARAFFISNLRKKIPKRI